MPLQITMNPRPAGNLSISANQRARFSSVVSLGWDQITGKPTITDFAETLLDDETAAAARATLGLTYGTGVREVLTANRDYYVRSDGSDSNTGLANTAAGAFLTIQKAWSVIHDSLDLNGYKVTINVGAGTFAGAAFTGPPVGGGGGGPGPVILLGAGAASTTINSTVIVKDHGRLQIGSFKIATASGSGILIQNHSTVYLYDGGMEFGACATSLVNAYNCSALIGQTGFGFTISGGATYGFLVSTLSNVTLSASATYTITGTPAFSTAFVCCIDNSVFNPGTGSAFSGSATGPRYNLAINSAIDMEDITANLPGDSAGSVTWGSSFYATNAIDVIGVGSRTLQLVNAGLVVTPQSSGFASWSSGNLTSVGSTILAAANGGTGVNNSPYTITLSGSSVAITPQASGFATWTTGTLAGVGSAVLPVANGGTGKSTAAEAVGKLIQALTEDTAPDWAADYVGSYDGSADTGKKLLLSTFTRKRLAANLTLYVNDSTGSDSNTGLASNAAFATVQKAYNVITGTLDLAGYDVTISIADATYDPASGTPILTVSQPWTGGGTVTLQGNTSTPTNVLFSATSANCVTVTATLPGSLTFKGIGFASTTSGNAISHGGAGTVNVDNCDFGAVSGGGVHMLAYSPSAFIQIASNYTISGGTTGRHWNTQNGGVISCISKTITITGTPAFGIFAYASRLSEIEAYSNTYSGSATGTRYLVNNNSVIFTNGAGATALPGDVGGSTATGGQYI